MSSAITAVAYVAIAATVISAGATAYSQIAAANAQSTAAKNNNKVAEQAARNQELEFAEASKRERISNRSKLAALQAEMANTGFVSTVGTPLLLMGEMAGRLELGVQDAARGANMQAAALRAKGQMGLFEAKVAKSALPYAVAGTVASGAAKVAGAL